MMDKIKLIDCLENDYNDCVLYNSFMSCKTLLEKMLNEAHWDPEEKGPHYNKHVCKEGEEYTGTEDTTGRIKFPFMSFGRYLYKAENLADAKPLGSNQIDSGVFGWKTPFGNMRNIVHIKFKKNGGLLDEDGNPLYEYVAYRPVFSNQVIRKNIDGVDLVFYKIIDRLVFSYGISRNPEKDFPKEMSFGPNELEESMQKITESILKEANRQQLLQKSRNAQNYASSNQGKGKNRYDRRNKSSISATVRDYNMIQMDPLFKRDILEFKIPVMGETDVYTVDVRVDGLLAEIRKQVMTNKGKLEFKVVLQSLMKVFNIGNVYIGCSCPDNVYRQAYYQTKNDYKAGYKERRPSNITNPNDTLGAGCKHILLVLANLDWAVKVASVINNYIKYCREHLESNYADYIFPKVYGVQYDKAVQLNLFDDGLLPDDAATMKAVIDQSMRGKDKSGRFVPGNDMRFQKKDLEEPKESEDQLTIDLANPEEVETVDIEASDEEENNG